MLTRATVPADRVRAWITVIDTAGHAMTEVDAVFPQALADAGDDPGLLALIRYQLAWRALLVEGDFDEAREEAARSAALAEQGGDRYNELMALAFQAQIETLMGHPDAPATIKRALKEPQDPRVACHHNGAGLLPLPLADHERPAVRGPRDGHRAAARGAAARVGRERGALPARGCRDRAAFRALRAGPRPGPGEPDDGPGHRDRRGRLGCARLHRGGLGRQCRAGPRTGPGGGRPRRGERRPDVRVPGLAVLGYAQLVAGDAPGAVRSLRRVRELEHGLGITDPARGRWQGDLAEALVRIGEIGEAQDVIDVTRVNALRLGRESVLAVLDRAEALVRAARGEHEAALVQLTSVQDRLAKLGYGLEEARAAFVLAQLRTRRPGPTSYDESARLFRRCRALPWLRQVEAAALARPEEQVTVTAAASDGLDSLEGLASMERQVAALVMEGATNREIAARLFISVKTVEATLTRVYRKLGIRSRVDIVRLAAGRRSP